MRVLFASSISGVGGKTHGSRGAVNHVADSFDTRGNSKATRPQDRQESGTFILKISVCVCDLSIIC